MNIDSQNRWAWHQGLLQPLKAGPRVRFNHLARSRIIPGWKIGMGKEKPGGPDLTLLRSHMPIADRAR